MIDYIVIFFTGPFFAIMSGSFFCFTLVATVYLAVKGILIVLLRLGISLAKRRIAIFAKCDEFAILKRALIESKLFKRKNILQISKDDIDLIGKESLLLVHWKSFNDVLDDVLQRKNPFAALIIYAPPKEGRIDDESMKKLGKYRNVIVVNFKGRLLNDVLLCMMTSRIFK